MLSTWVSLVTDTVDRYAPLKTLRVKSLKKPTWLNDEILTAIGERDEFKKTLQKGQIQRDTFKAARNKVVRLVEKAKKYHIVNEIENNKFDSKALWKTLKTFSLTKATKSGKVKSLEKDGTMYATPEEISNLFNEHFVAVANNIIESNNSTYLEFTKLENFVRPASKRH